MISGVHAIVFSPAAEALRAFFRDTLGLSSVDAGDGWLIFALPPAELAVHPAEAARHEIYLLCQDLDATVATLEKKGVGPPCGHRPARRLRDRALRARPSATQQAVGRSCA
jgi:hypothetical protein